MAKIIHERTAADIEGDVVLLIGMWINRFFRVDQWIWALRAMLQMLKELSRQKDSGLNGRSFSGSTIPVRINCRASSRSRLNPRTTFEKTCAYGS
jgi:hypothetical protein